MQSVVNAKCPVIATGGSAQMRGFATGVGSNAGIGAAAADPTLVFEDTT